MTDLATRIADVKKKAEAATPGMWHTAVAFWKNGFSDSTCQYLAAACAYRGEKG